MDTGMVDVSRKYDTMRGATAQAIIKVKPATLNLIRKQGSPKGDVAEAAKLAGTMAAKQTSFLIPYCHPVPLDHVKIVVSLLEEDSSAAAIEVRAEVASIWKTGVEMESLTAACVGALTIYDMLKPVDDSLVIESVRLVEKHGGKSEHYKKLATRDRPLNAAVLVTSDSRDEKQDESGKLAMDRLLENGFEIADYRVISNDVDSIQYELKRLADDLKVDMIITSGGTGLGPRDVTPEATERVIEKKMDGVSETLRAYGQRRTEASMLSRGVAGIRRDTVIINLPGSPRAVSESLDALFPGILHVYEVLHDSNSRGGQHHFP